MRPIGDEQLPLVESLRGARGRTQLVTRLRAAITSGALTDGEALPATRTLAATLGIARGSLVQAYDELAGEGFLEATPGGVTRVAAAVSARAVPAVRETVVRAETATARIDLRPGRPGTTGLDADPAWRAAWRRGAAPVPVDLPDLAGDPGLRAEIAAHVRRSRGVDCRADDVVITAGTAEGFQLLLLALRRGGTRSRVGVEDPGYRFARRTVDVLGDIAVPIPVAEGSIDPAALSGLDAVIVTPSHQYPLGGAMPVARRYALLDWARRTGAVIIEDDYDSEFRHGSAPLPAITGLVPHAPAALVGTFSKTISPALRLGYVVATDPALRARLLATRDLLSTPVSQQVQDAVCAFLRSGGLQRHIARMRRVYAHRRGLVAALALPAEMRMSGLEGGLHAVISWPRGAASGASLVARLRRAGIATGVLDDYRMTDPGDADEGIVIGYAAPTDLDLAEALRVIAGS